MSGRIDHMASVASIGPETLRAEALSRLDRLFLDFGDKIAGIASKEGVEAVLERKDRVIAQRDETIDRQRAKLKDTVNELSRLRGRMEAAGKQHQARIADKDRIIADAGWAAEPADGSP